MTHTVAQAAAMNSFIVLFFVCVMEPSFGSVCVRVRVQERKRHFILSFHSALEGILLKRCCTEDPSLANKGTLDLWFCSYSVQVSQFLTVQSLARVKKKIYPVWQDLS